MTLCYVNCKSIFPPLKNAWTAENPWCKQLYSGIERIAVFLWLYFMSTYKMWARQFSYQSSHKLYHIHKPLSQCFNHSVFQSFWPTFRAIPLLQFLNHDSWHFKRPFFQRAGICSPKIAGNFFLKHFFFHLFASGNQFPIVHCNENYILFSNFSWKNEFCG